jgi:hypothetical protein
LPKQSDPSVVLADAAGWLRRSEKRPVLAPELRGQVAWLVADRVNRFDGAMPGFDPSGLAPRERWERMLDVLDPARKLTASLGLATGVDLCASPLPRMEIVDDRVVPAGHRRRLPAASLQALPIGKWVEVGPYTADEWAARGEQGSGRGAFLRLNGCAYLAAVEHGDEATWRLDDIDTRTGFGQLASGTATSLDDAKRTAVTAMHDRYPVLSATPLVAIAGASRPGGVWEPMAGSGRSAAEQRRLPCEVTIYVIPSSGGRWMPALNVGPGGDIERLPLVKGIDAARDAAETAGRRAVRGATLRTPVGVDGVVAELATSDDYSRDELAALTQARLLPDDQSRIAEAEPAELVELLGQAGVTPATTVAVLRAEHVDAADVAALLPTIGVPIADGIRALHTQWELSLPDAAEALDANATEMRAAGCSPVQIMAARPRDVLRVLPDDPHLWDLAAGTMATAGHSDGQIASHLVAHAPSVEAFVAGMGALTDDVATAMVLATSYGASGEYLAGASEHYGLSPAETAQVLTSLDVSAQLRVETLWERCDHDPDATRDLAVAHAALDQPTIRRCLRIAGLAPADEALSPATLANSVIDIGDADALIAQLPAPTLPAAVEPAAPTADHQLTFPTPQLTGQQP